MCTFASNFHTDPNFLELKKIIEGKDEHGENNVVAFFGSGMSTNLCSWNNLIQQVCNNCDIDEGKNLSKDVDVAKNLELAEKAKDRNQKLYWQVLVDVFGGDYMNHYYPLLTDIPFKCYVTTNYDHQLADCSRGKLPPTSQFGKIFRFKESTPADIRNRNIHYVHGYIPRVNDDTPEIDLQIVLTHSEFEDAYKKSSRLPLFLTDLFTNHNLLFLGCELKEQKLIDLLEDCMAVRADGGNRPDANKRFILKSAIYSNKNRDRQFELENDEKKFYEKYGITVLRFENKKNNFALLHDILAALAGRSPHNFFSPPSIKI